jgi:ABC-type nitrate/sulfonate/bicarbonate transport system permease component
VLWRVELRWQTIPSGLAAKRLYAPTTTERSWSSKRDDVGCVRKAMAQSQVKGRQLPIGKSNRMNPRVVRYPHHRHKPLYDIPLSHHLISGLAALGIALGCTTLLLHFVYPQNAFDINRIAFREIALGALNTLCRLVLAFFLALVVAVPLALFIASTPRTQRILLPLVDVFQSIPVLAFFPVVAVFFVAHHAFELAAVFVLFLSMLWNVVFPVIGGLQTIPDDIHSAALVFKVRGWNKFRYITLPALFPFMVTGLLLAWAQGWTIVITAMNIAVWQPLLNLSKRFRFD